MVSLPSKLHKQIETLQDNLHKTLYSETLHLHLYCTLFVANVLISCLFKEADNNSCLTLVITRNVVNMWRGTNPDHNANKTTADVVLALKQFKQITQQPQNTASSRARYDDCLSF